jgi:integrase
MAGLTAKSIEQARAGTARREVPDGKCAGLFLVIQPSGAKSWALRFRSPIERDEHGQRKAKKLTLGTFTDKPAASEPKIGHPLTVGQARMLATAAMEDIRRGTDPTHVRREQKDEAKKDAVAAQDNTVDAAMVEFLKRYRGKKRQGLRASTRNLTAHYFGLKPDPEKPGEWIKRDPAGGVLKSWSGRPLTSITKSNAIALLESIIDTGHDVTANRTLTNLKTFFGWCVKQDKLTSSPVAVLDAPGEEVSRERTLSDAELVALWRAADDEAYPFGRMVQLLVLSGARRDEARKAPWSEFELKETSIALPSGAQWKGPLWTLPALRAKNNREHLVPLSATALHMLQKMARTSNSAFLFTTTGDTPISGISKVKQRLHSAMLADLRKTDPNCVLEPWSLHDLRRTFYSGLQALGFSIEVAEACVNHKGGTLSGVAKVYGRHKYLAEKTAAFEAWARHVDALVNGTTGGNVVALHGVRQ